MAIHQIKVTLVLEVLEVDLAVTVMEMQELEVQVLQDKDLMEEMRVDNFILVEVVVLEAWVLVLLDQLTEVQENNILLLVLIIGLVVEVVPDTLQVAVTVELVVVVVVVQAQLLEAVRLLIVELQVVVDVQAVGLIRPEEMLVQIPVVEVEVVLITTLIIKEEKVVLEL